MAKKLTVRLSEVNHSAGFNQGICHAATGLQRNIALMRYPTG
jgi:hypothetical protein